MIDQADAVVVGAGAFGASVAYHLTRLGTKRVALIDQHEVASQTSPRAAGLFKSIRTSDLMTRLAIQSIRKIERFADETGEPMVFYNPGALMIARTPQQEEHIHAEVARGWRLGLEIDHISLAEARRLTPFLEGAGIRAVSRTLTDIYLEPVQIPLGYARAAARLGATVLPRTTVTGIEVRDGTVTGVKTDQGEIKTPIVVSAAGAWTRHLGAMADRRIPIVPTRHQLLITEPIPGVVPEHPLVRIGDAQVYLRPEKGGFLIGGYESDPLQYDDTALSPGFQIPDLPLDLRVLRRLIDGVVDQFPVFRDFGVREHRGGLPTMTPDGQHIVGPVPGVDGFFVISGCCVAGLSISPSLGEALAQWIVDGKPPLDLSALAPDRFGPEYLSEERLKADCRELYANTYTHL